MEGTPRSHHWKKPAKLMLVDSDDVGHGVEFLFSQNLFRHLWQQHAINDRGQEGMALGRMASWCLGFPSRGHIHVPFSTV